MIDIEPYSPTQVRTFEQIMAEIRRVYAEPDAPSRVQGGTKKPPVEVPLAARY